MDHLFIYKKGTTIPVVEIVNNQGELQLFGDSNLGITLMKSGDLDQIGQSINRYSSQFDAILAKDEPPVEEADPALEPIGELTPEQQEVPVEPIVTEDVSTRVGPALKILKELIKLSEKRRQDEAEHDAHLDAATLEQQNAEKLADKPTMVFVSMDGDNIGNKVAAAEAHDDENTMREVSSRIASGQDILSNWALQYAGTVIQSGGDEGLVKVSNAALDHLQELRDSYKDAVGATLTVGVGNTISQSTKARALGKLRGKDQVCFFDENTEAELTLRMQQEGELTPQKKLEASGVLQNEAEAKPGEVKEPAI